MTCALCDDDHPLGGHCPVEGCPYMVMIVWCNCEHSIIRCGDRGCRCTRCGNPEKPKYVRQRELDQQYPPPSVPDWMSRSYPYLSIATHYGLDYGVVLHDADPGTGWPHPELEGYVESLRAARAMWLYVQAVGMTEALERLGPHN